MRIPKSLLLVCLTALLFSLVACAPKSRITDERGLFKYVQYEPDSYIVLLADPGGRPSRIVVTTEAGDTPLSETGGALEILPTGARPIRISDEQLERDFGAAMAARPPIPRTFILYFDTGGVQLTAESEAQLPDIRAAVMDFPAPDIAITGHADTVGSPEVNERISLQRAQFVAEWLVESDVQAVELIVTSHGQRNLLVPTGDGLDEPRNRRVEVTVR